MLMVVMLIRKPLIFFIVIVSFSVLGCTIHKLDVQQGNVITEDMVSRLSIGMTPRQVRFVMGTPLVHDPFHKNRWDYVYYFQPGDQRTFSEWKKVTVFFEKGQLAKIDSRLQ